MTEFFIVDVFAETRYAGNPLAVVRGGSDLSDAALMAIVREMNYSETTFILSDTPRDGGYDVRIFTMSTELPFAGHPTLGTAAVIRAFIAPDTPDAITLNEKVGPIPVTFAEDGVAWMRQNPPQFGATYDPAAMAAALGLPAEAVDTRFPPQTVSTGGPFTIAALASLQAVQSVKVDWQKYREIVPALPAVFDGLLIFAPEPMQAENDLHARALFDDPYLSEDPATGAANGCLAGYLSQHAYFGSDVVDCRVEQGYMVGRPSLLLLKANADADGQIAVQVGGRVQMVARGTLLSEG